MYNANYMDDVPVKIAEKYKPPPPIYKLPQPLANKLNLEENFYWDCPIFLCDLQLERRALSKIEQWKRLRQRHKEQRRERILKREQQRKRYDEDRQKNLLYNVSYPSTDDLSSEEDEEKVKLYEENKIKDKCISETKEISPHACVRETANSFHNILQPTVLSLINSSTAVRAPTPIVKSTNENKMSNSFNYKDFEDDTSSPFDNIELKTINDLDVLAQVLHNTKINCLANEKLNENVVSSDSTNESPKQCYPDRESKTKIQTNSLADAENIPKPNNKLPQFNYEFNSHQKAFKELKEHDLIFGSSIPYKDNLPLQSPHNMLNELKNSYGYHSYQSNHCNQSTRQQQLVDDQITKSKSVPDILKELRDEIQKSEIRRYRNCSYNIGDNTEHIGLCLAKVSTAKNTDVNSESIISELDSKAKGLVEKISAMGFPFKRVERIVQLVGTDDKKIIEHLILLSELSDLGFDEGKISDALIRNENNKNKALEDLIS